MCYDNRKILVGGISMIMGFIIWTLCSLIFFIIGISTWNSKKEVGFFTGVKPNPMKDVKAYNRAVAKIWIVFGALFELLGVPFLFFEQNSPIFLLSAVGTMFLVIGIIIAYMRVEAKYRK